MEYILIGFLAAAFGVAVTLFLNRLAKWQKEQKKEEE